MANEAYICRIDQNLAAGAVQITDLRPNTSRRSLTYEKVPQSGYMPAYAENDDVTAAANQYWVVTASGRTITLPATPAVGDTVTVVVNGEFTDTVVARNGSRIMGLAEDITLDKNYAAMDFTYVDATEGWRLS